MSYAAKKLLSRTSGGLGRNNINNQNTYFAYPVDG